MPTQNDDESLTSVSRNGDATKKFRPLGSAEFTKLHTRPILRNTMTSTIKFNGATFTLTPSGVLEQVLHEEEEETPITTYGRLESNLVTSAIARVGSPPPHHASKYGLIGSDVHGTRSRL
ncbi:hypothetical protein BASA81_007909 [Batrachochytrium salamandrivorans]|nr:hypothetical protein BASA81_007909 [Batrachochytrium salamandrivorans]